MLLRMPKQTSKLGKAKYGIGRGVMVKESWEQISSLARNLKPGWGWGLGWEIFWHLKSCQGFRCCCWEEDDDSKNAFRFAIAASRFASICFRCSSVSSIADWMNESRVCVFKSLYTIDCNSVLVNVSTYITIFYILNIDDFWFFSL